MTTKEQKEAWAKQETVRRVAQFVQAAVAAMWRGTKKRPEYLEKERGHAKRSLEGV